MLKSCKYCGRIHKRSFDCGKKPKRRKEPTKINKFRWSRKWRKKRNDIVERDNHLCQICKENNKFTYNNLEVHHIVPLEEDYELRLDDENLITLCTTHHKEADKGDISREHLKKIVGVPPAYDELIF